eukprot:c4725_g1_i1.p1 GENE.c4725_g1_i1~~c4725_g1_i1.p1  ORF type:complete len:608 (+),score=168.00 c4725_g1_i1:32-1825(+)
MSSLNPKASAWTPNPNASSFVPGQFTAQPAAVKAPVVVPPANPGSKMVFSLVSTPSTPAPAAAAAPAPAAAPAAAAKPAAAKPAPAPAPAPAEDRDWDQVDAEDACLNIVIEPVTKGVADLKVSTPAPAPTPAPKAAPKPEPVPVAAEEEEGGDEEEFEEQLEIDVHARRHVNLVFIGHVDAGKSTLCGHIMYQTGMVDDRTMDKFAREAKALNRETWKFAWAMDITDAERAKGKTEECGIGWFKTENKQFTVLDAPGHKSYVPHMIGGASQADVAILVISARRGEFETGFEKGGQTREHAMLAKTVGVRQLVVAVTKMDDPTVLWDKARFDEILEKLGVFLKQVGFAPNEVVWIPISGLQGINIKDRNTPEQCPWYSGPSLLGYLDEMKPPERLYDRPLRLPISAKYKDRGVMVIGKLEAGTIKMGERLVMMPNRNQVIAEKLFLDAAPISAAEPGDNVRIKLLNINEEDISSGFVLCRPDDLVPVVSKFRARVIVLEHKSIITAGYTCVMHIHSVVQEVTFDEMEAITDKKGSKVLQQNPKFVRPGQTVMAKMVLESAACIQAYKDYQQLGRFMLRDEGKTIAIGVITDILETVS